MVGVVYLDLRKAFDLVDHEILLHKLQLHHFSSRSVRLFKSYLANRTQKIQLGNMQSKMSQVSTGVPQGSILGPLLFIIYINDLALLHPTLNIDLYADDSTVYRSGNQLVEMEIKLQEDLNYVSNWCDINNMALHHSKTKCMLLGSVFKIKNNRNLQLYIKNSKLENVTTQKLLGVYIDNLLNWHTQVEYVCKTLNKKIALLKRIIYFLTPEMRILFYNAYIMPVFDYCCLVWGIASQKDINKISSLQKRIIKIILNKSKFTPSVELFQELNILSFSDRCKYHSAVIVYKIWNNLVPSYMSDFVSFSQNNMYNLRSITNNDVVLQNRHKTKYMRTSFAYYSKNVWNSIPIEIRRSNNIRTFKKNVKQFLMGKFDSFHAIKQ